MRRKISVIMYAIALVVVIAFVAICLTGCTEANMVNDKLSKKAQYFECERRIIVYNAISDKKILEIEGYLDIENNSNNELVVTCKVGEDQYKKNYIYLNDNFTMYTVEDITGTHTDPYHYTMYYNIYKIPGIEFKH